MTTSRGSSYVRIGTHPWTIDIIFREPVGGQESVALSTGRRAVLPGRRSFIATGRRRRLPPSRFQDADTVSRDRRRAEKRLPSAGQAPARNVERKRGRVRHIQAFYRSRQIDTDNLIASGFCQLP